MMRLASIIVLGAMLSSPAFATEWISCSDAGGLASFDYLAGDGTGVLSIAAVTITTGDKVWASDTANGPGDPVSVGQQFEDSQTIVVDAMDKDFGKLAELRLFKASEGEAHIYGGTLRIVGYGAWVVSCDPLAG
ncbi:MAG: hypothetical protein ABIQ30_02350 [Devosia sp.]